jgi:hypothetical protein
MPEETSAALVSSDLAVLRQVLVKALELVNSGDNGSYGLAMKAVLQFADNARAEAALPPVAITYGPTVLRRYLVLEISGGDEITAKSWYGLAELEFEHLLEFLQELLKDLPLRARKNPPAVVLHKPAAVEA